MGFKATFSLLLAAAIAAGLFQYTRWKTFAPTGGRFSIEIPGGGGSIFTRGLGHPERIGTSISTAVGKVEMVTYSTGHWGKDFLIGYADFPESAGALTDLEAIFDGAARSVTSKYQGEVTKQRRITKDEHVGRETYLKVKKGVTFTVAFRVYLVERRLFLLVVAVPSLQGTSPDFERFFDSFQPS